MRNHKQGSPPGYWQQAEPPRKRMLLVDDEPDALDSLRDALRCYATSGTSASLAAASERSPSPTPSPTPSSHDSPTASS